MSDFRPAAFLHLPAGCCRDIISVVYRDISADCRNLLPAAGGSRAGLEPRSKGSISKGTPKEIFRSGGPAGLLSPRTLTAHGSRNSRVQYES